MVVRIVSFLPSITELIYELGAEDSLFGVTHECTYPPDAKTKPRIINSVFDPEVMSSVEIDKKVSELAREGKDIFIVQESNLREADPDLIIAQGTCAVCSAYKSEVKKALQILNDKPHVEVLDPHTTEDILSSVTTIAKRIGREKEGQKLVEVLKNRIDGVESRRHSSRPNVLCVEWVNPFFTAGHWVPQMVDASGGNNLISEVGERSRRLTMDEIEEADPDIIVMMPCGFDVQRTQSEYSTMVQSNEQWKDLRAYKDGKIFAVDANSYFSKPSIRTITGIEILAKIIHPDEFSELNVPPESFRKI